MKRLSLCILLTMVLLFLAACSGTEAKANITATTMPVYTFTQALCRDTPLQVELLVQENVSCLHDYTLTIRHMKNLEKAEVVVISGGGLEDFLSDVITDSKTVIDASLGIEQHCAEEPSDHEHAHHHEQDPHFWLSIQNARKMAHNIYDRLAGLYPQFSAQFQSNLVLLDRQFKALEAYAQEQLSSLACRKIISFHDGFSYMAEDLNLSILYSIEEESGSEASAKDLAFICDLVAEQHIPAVFTEKNGSVAAAEVICRETGCKQYNLDMAMSGSDYFEAMYTNIDTLKEALG